MVIAGPSNTSSMPRRFKRKSKQLLVAAHSPDASPTKTDPAATVASAPQAASPPQQRRGDEEFERQLQMAILATKEDGAVGSSTATVSAPAAQRPGGSTPTPVPQRPASLFWAEAFCGSSSDGAWVHVDGFAGIVGAPGVVEASGRARPTVGYVAAFLDGAVKDVTRRYAASYVKTLRARDEKWFTEVMKPLRGTVRPWCLLWGRLPASRVGALWCPLAIERAAFDDMCRRMCAACCGPCMRHCEFEPLPRSAWLQCQAVCTRTCGDLLGICNVALAVEVATAVHLLRGGSHAVHCTLTLDSELATIKLAAAAVSLQVSPHQAQSGTARSDPAAPATAARVAPALKRGSAPASGAGCSHGVDAAVLAERREDAELAQQEVKERTSLPKTIDGFKRHPVYVLKRHISRYQGLTPGASQLGVHRGEPYYDRAAVVELHAAGRWKRLGFEVLPGELSQPAKIITHSKGKAGAKATGRGRTAAKEDLPTDGAAQTAEEVPPPSCITCCPQTIGHTDVNLEPCFAMPHTAARMPCYAEVGMKLPGSTCLG